MTGTRFRTPHARPGCARRPGPRRAGHGAALRGVLPKHGPVEPRAPWVPSRGPGRHALLDAQFARAELRAWLSWARRCRLAPFKKLARTITERADAVVRGMTDNRSNAFVEAMNGLLQQAKRAARGFRTASNFIAIAYLRMSRLRHLPAHPFAPALAK